MTLMQMEWELACVICKATFHLNTTQETETGNVICPNCKGWSGHNHTKILICSTRTSPDNNIVGFCARCERPVYLNEDVRDVKKRYCIPCVGWMMRDQVNKAKKLFEKTKPLTN